MNVFRQYITVAVIAIGIIVVITYGKTTANAAYECVNRPSCPNACDMTSSQCVPDASGNPRPCTLADQGWWCIAPIRCDASLPAKVAQQVFFCDGTKWILKGSESPPS